MSPQRKRKPTDGIRQRRSDTVPDVVEKKGMEADEVSAASRYEEGDIVVTERADTTNLESQKKEEEAITQSVIHPPSRDVDLRDVAVKNWFDHLRSDQSARNGTGGKQHDESFGKISEISRAPRRMFRRGIVIGFISILVLFVIISTTFARATIRVTPRVDTHTIESLVFGLDTSVSGVLIPQRVVPSEYLTFSRTAGDEFEATGNQFIAEKARGRVRIYNRFSSLSQTLVATTRFLTDSGKLYRLPRTTQVPGAKIEDGVIVPQFVEVELIADKTGEEFNVSGEVRLSIPGFQDSPKFQGFYGSAPSGFSGGFQGETQVVSQDDTRKAQERVTEKVFSELQQEVVRKIPPDFKIIDALTEIKIVSVDAPSAGTRAQRFSVGAEATSDVLVFREADVLTLLKDAVVGDDGSQKLMDGSANVKYQVRTLDFRAGTAGVVVDGTLKTQTVIVPDLLKETLVGKKEGSLVEILKKRDEIAQFRISLFPPWRSKAPADLEKIHVVIEDQ